MDLCPPCAGIFFAASGGDIDTLPGLAACHEKVRLTGTPKVTGRKTVDKKEARLCGLSYLWFVSSTRIIWCW
jgi:hypothetical protein